MRDKILKIRLASDLRTFTRMFLLVLVPVLFSNTIVTAYLIDPCGAIELEEKNESESKEDNSNEKEFEIDDFLKTDYFRLSSRREIVLAKHNTLLFNTICFDILTPPPKSHLAT